MATNARKALDDSCQRENTQKLNSEGPTTEPYGIPQVRGAMSEENMSVLKQNISCKTDRTKANPVQSHKYGPALFSCQNTMKKISNNWRNAETIVTILDKAVSFSKTIEKTTCKNLS